MTRFNKRNPVVTRTSEHVIWTVGGPHPATHEGGLGAKREAKGELFLLGASTLDITADTFYERADDRVRRFAELVHEVAVVDPDWIFEYLKWLRGPGNIRTAAIVGAVEAVDALLKAEITGGRSIIDAVCQRPDEPGEVLAYAARVFGRRIPKPIKRGVADAAERLYNQWSLLKYDTASHGYRFADVLELTHPWPNSALQGALFKYAIDRRHNREGAVPAELALVAANLAIRDQVAGGDYTPLTDPQLLHDGWMTWEDALSLAGKNVPKADVWRATIPAMPFMARLRNLRNFDQAGLSDDDVKSVVDMLGDPEQVTRSRQLPMRFLSAFRAAGANLRWAYPLEKALDLSLANVPVLPGRTLILVDTSSSMHDRMSAKSELLRWDAAVVFGLALACRCESVDVASFASDSKVFPLRKAASLLSEVSRWKDGGYFLGGGTNTPVAVRRHYHGHDRVIVLTDEQYGSGPSWYRTSSADPQTFVPQDKLFYTFNLAGYEVAQVESSPTRVTIGGLSDQMFGLIPTIEANRTKGVWPWEMDN